MRYEVEQKYRVTTLDKVRREISVLGARGEGTVTQVDTYYAHPNRDFATTDEALRIRRVGEVNVLTYKGPKIDATTKTRQEIELSIAAGSLGAEQGDHLLQAFGFRRVAEVCKERQCFRLQRDDQAVELALDEVKGVGSFVELEIVVDGEDSIEPARQAIAKLAEELDLAEVERRSYLELLLS